MELEQRIASCEQTIKKLGKVVKEIQSNLNVSQGKVDITDQSTADNLSQMNQQMSQQIQTLSQRLDALEAQVSRDVQEVNKRVDEVRPKVARVKSRKEFTSDEAYVEYMGNTNKEWDVQKDGRILVRINPDLAEGKAKHFIGYIGEIVKWTSTVCKVQWFGLATQESVKWQCLDVFLPASAFYFPDCPHARSVDSVQPTAEKKL